MKKKLTKIIGVALAAVFSLGLFAGCDLITTNNEADMAQVVAEVNIANDRESLDSALKTLDSPLQSGSDVESKLGDVLSTDEIYKRDLVAYFISYGYNYLSNNSNDYAATFEQIMDDLVQRKVLVQFATIYYLNEGEVRVDPDFIDFTEDYNPDPEGPNSDARVMAGNVSVTNYLNATAEAGENATSDEIALAGLSIFLTEDEKKYAEYQVMQAINSSIDSYEQDIIDAEEDSTSSETARTTPTGANEVDAFYPTDENGELNYGVYTGFGNSDYGEYERLDGSTAVTRKRAYLRFLNALNQNYLLQDEDVETALTDITALSYYDIELCSQYEMLLINKFNASIALDMSDVFASETLENYYNQMLTTQSLSTTDFVSTMDSVSDSSFVLYSPANRTYGYVYNILLPFNADQTLTLTELQNAYGSETRAYYAARQALFQGITATDQRKTWFNGSEDYSFNAEDYGMTKGTTETSDYYDNGNNSTYLFFKDSFVAQGTRTAEGIDRYAGKYPYNGTVDVRNDGSYELIPNKIESIDDFISEMEGFINYVAGYGESDEGRAHGTKDETFYDVTADDFGGNDNDIDYSRTIYYKGSVDIGYPADKEDKAAQQEFAANYMTKEGSTAYQVLSAVNELMFAYSTDTGCLNSYLGYSIASKEEATTYVAEFEYAAQEAITNGGPGTYYVVGTDYGWHILYVSYVYTGGATYEGFDYLQRGQEGTFSYFFYQSQKSSVAQDYSDEVVGAIFRRMQNSDSVVTKYENRYSDLTSIGA